MLLGPFVVADVFERRVVHLVSFLVDAVDVDGGLIHGCALLVEQLQVQRVVLFEQARTHPVEVHQFAVLVFREFEGGQQAWYVKLVVDVDARVQVLQVQFQFHVAVALIARHQVHLAERVAFGHVEALEIGFLQFQHMALGVHLVVGVAVGGDVFHLVGVARRLPLLVELEDIDVVVVPVVAPVAQLVEVVGIVRTPHLHRRLLLLERNVGKEVVACGKRERHGFSLVVVAVVHLNVIDTRLAAAVVDAKAEQRVVAHAPELLQFRQALHLGRTEHFLDLVHLVLVAVDGVLVQLAPGKFLVQECRVRKMGGICDVLGIVEVKVLC